VCRPTRSGVTEFRIGMRCSTIMSRYGERVVWCCPSQRNPPDELEFFVRRLVAATAVAAALILGITGCGTEEEKSAPSAAAPTTAAAASTPDPKAATTAACKEAVSVGEANTASFEAEFKAMLDAAMSGDEAKATELEKAFRAKVKAWADKLTTLAGQEVDPAVKAAFTEAAATITALNSPDDKTPANQVTKKLAEVAQKVKTACS
jgi:hypothetical protein